jgi:penicillin-binding protein 2
LIYQAKNLGLIPSPAAKQKVFGEEWGLGDTFNSAIGQGLTLVTPIQLAQMLSIVANNGVLEAALFGRKGFK